MRDPIGVARFTTDDFAPAMRQDDWANRNWPAIGPISETPIVADGPFGSLHDAAERVALGEVIVHLSGLGAQPCRRPARARRDGADGLAVEMLSSGETGEATAGLTFDDLSQRHGPVAAGTSALLLTVPRALAERNHIDPAALHGRRLSAATADLLRSHLLAVQALLPLPDIAQRERLGQIALDLIGVALDIAGLRAPAARIEARDTATVAEARRLVEAHLHSPLLTVGWLCGRLGVSRSRLYRLFDDAGGIRTFIRDRRLERIRAILAGPRGDRLADLAESWGFSDAAHLSRSFRARFGVAPSDYRALHGGG